MGEEGAKEKRTGEIARRERSEPGLRSQVSGLVSVIREDKIDRRQNREDKIEKTKSNERTLPVPERS